MNIETTERFLDDEGNPIEEVALENARYERVSVRHVREDGLLEVRAHDTATDRVEEFQLSLVDELFQGAKFRDALRRDMDDDIQDALLHLSYVALDGI